MIAPDHISSKIFSIWTETSFIVLPDQKSVIGLKFESFDIWMENIMNKKSCCVSNGVHKYYVHTIYYDETTCSLFSGDNMSMVIQYKKNIKNGWKMVKKYSDLKINWIYSSTRIGNLMIFGGNNYHFTVIDAMEKQVVIRSTRIKINLATSLQVCKVYPDNNDDSDSHKYALSFSGSFPHFVLDKLDILDITGLVNQNVNKKILGNKYFEN
jgi:hypothetical protein